MHVAALIILLGVSQLGGFSLGEDLSDHAVAHFNLDFTDDTVLPLAVTCSIQENDTFQDRSIGFLNILILAVFIVRYKVTKVFDWHLGISNNELLIVLVKHH